MTQIVHARSAELRQPAYMRDTVLVAASVYGENGFRYVTGRATTRGEALLERREHSSYRQMVATYLLMAVAHSAEPEARIADHPGLCPVDVTIHARDGATVLVSAIHRPGATFWVGTRYVVETYPGALTP